MLDGDACRPADVAVLMAEMFPGLGHCAGGVGLVKCLEAVAEFACCGVFARGLGRCGVFLTNIGHSVQGALAAAPPYGEVHCTVIRVDHGVGHAHLRAGNKLLALGGVRGTGRGEEHRGHGAVGPIETVNCLLILGWELGSQTGDYAHR